MKRIPLFSKQSSDIVGWALVDDNDYIKLAKYRWHKSSDGRAVRAHGDTFIQMGRQIMGVVKQKDVSIVHKDGNTLNNQRSNLRTVNIK